MTFGGRRQLRMVLVTVVLLVAGALSADRARAQSSLSCLTATSCVTMSVTANLQLADLHSAVTNVRMYCTATIPPNSPIAPNGEVYGSSNSAAVVNRGFTGSVTATIGIVRGVLADPASRTLNTTCRLELSDGTSTKAAVASAAQPVGMLNDNWHVVAARSTVTWTQGVTFPDANVR